MLTTKGRKTGEPTTVPLIYARDGGDCLVVASKSGVPGHPCVFEARREPRPARSASRLWRLALEQSPDYDAYQQRTDREIPFVVLERA